MFFALAAAAFADDSDFGWAVDLQHDLQKTWSPLTTESCRVELSAKVSSEGELLDYGVVRSTGNATCDAAALKALSNLAIPVPPASWTADDGVADVKLVVAHGAPVGHDSETVWVKVVEHDLRQAWHDVPRDCRADVRMIVRPDGTLRAAGAYALTRECQEAATKAVFAAAPYQPPPADLLHDGEAELKIRFGG
jgi:hypothetical protein